MALGDGAIIPAEPTLYAVYRGFYILPTDPLPTNAIAIDFFVARSQDDLTWENWQYLGRGDEENGFYFVHSGLDENTYYAYYIQYIYKDGSKGPVGGLASQQGQLNASSSLNIDQLASKAYTTGLVTSGIFQGVIFRTDPVNPKVQMDPSGIWATDGVGNIVFYIHDDGSPAFFKGLVEAEGVVLPLNTSNTFPPTFNSQVSWTSDSTNDGDLVSEIDTYISSSQSVLNSPGTVSQTAFGGATWATPSNGLLKDNIFTTVNLSNNGSYYLTFTNFGFTIPSDATINGVAVNVIRKAVGEVPMSDTAARLILTGSIAGSGEHSTGAIWSATTTNITYGSSSDLWSQTLTPSVINNSGFGFAIAGGCGQVRTSTFAPTRSGAMVANGFGIYGWNNPGSIIYNDGNNYAWSQAVAGQPETAMTYSLAATSFGFAIPSDALITGIAVYSVGAMITNGAGGPGNMKVMNALKAGGIVGTGINMNNYSTNAWSTVQTGGSATLWGTTWTPADINNSGFGVQFYGQPSSYIYGAGGKIQIAYVYIYIYYTLQTVTGYVDYVSIGVSYTAPGFGSGFSNNQLESYTYQIGSSDSSTSVMGARTSGGVTQAAIQTQYNPNQAIPSSVVATAGNNSVTIVDSAGLASKWITPTLINSWAAGSTVGYLKDPFGFVHLRGSVNLGASATNAFILPAGFRPGVTDYWPALQSGGAAGAFVHVDTSGNVTPTYTGGPVWLNAVSFLAEN